MSRLWSTINLNLLKHLKKKPKSSKEAGEFYFSKAQIVKDPFQKKKLLLTAAEYFEEAKDYDSAVQCLIMGNEQQKARTLCVRICNPSYLKKYLQNKTEIISTYVGCIVKSLNENNLNEARQLSMELLEFYNSDFTQAVLKVINSLESTNLIELDRALKSIQKSNANLIEDNIRKIFIDTLYSKCKDYGVLRDLSSIRIIPLICSNCRGTLNYNRDTGEAICQYCGMKIKIV